MADTPDDATQLDRLTKRLVREAYNLARLAHPNIIKVFGIRMEDQDPRLRPCLVMEWCGAGDVSQYLHDFDPDSRGRLALVRVIQPSREKKHLLSTNMSKLRDAAYGLQYLHSQKVAHGDIKPPNVFVKRAGNAAFIACLGDFGLARVIKEYRSPTGLTTFNEGISTGRYTAPEVLAPPDSTQPPEFTFASDSYAFGGLMLFVSVIQPVSTARSPHPRP
ncbi:hypothetical protein FRC01_011220 [Tulasnella sp. 417]|nr:hypothetical protein FRC01_011220 [Tulasnella sp. 417]